jgi:hypothetical protein
MLKRYVAKFVMDVFPSVIATIIGAYIVNHYIATKPGAVAPVTAAITAADPSAADPKATDAKSTDAKAAKSDVKGLDKGAETPSDVATEPGPAQKGTTETASLPVETRRHQSSGHDKTAAKSVPASAQTQVPTVAAVSSVPLVEANPPHEERRDATDLAREAIERLRGASEASRAPQVPRVQDAPRTAAAPVQPLPPPIVVASPSADGYNSGTTGSTSPVYPPVARAEDPRRPTPPGDIPTTAAPPMDIHDETMASMPEHKNVITVAQDVLSAAKSVFHAVLPH